MNKVQLWDEIPGMCEKEPILTYYPAANKKTDATVVIFPGGGYQMLSEYEGGGYAEFLNSIGIDAFVCYYRVAPHRFPLPLVDARRTVRHVRANAEVYGIDPNKIAVMGSSAGGHLATLVSNYMEPIEFEDIDEIDKVDARPNATILCYPVVCSPDESGVGHTGSYKNLLGEAMPDKEKYSTDLLVSDKTPIAFMWYTAEDEVNVINAYKYGIALKQHDIFHEMHVFHKGPHGLGVATEVPHVAQWTRLLENWLIEIGWLSAQMEN